MENHDIQLQKTVFSVDFVSDDNDEILYSLPMTVFPVYSVGQIITVINDGMANSEQKPWVTKFRVKSVEHTIFIAHETFSTDDYRVHVRLEVLEENWGSIVLEKLPTE
jgi:hypothetical protein